MPMRSRGWWRSLATSKGKETGTCRPIFCTGGVAVLVGGDPGAEAKILVVEAVEQIAATSRIRARWRSCPHRANRRRRSDRDSGSWRPSGWTVAIRSQPASAFAAYAAGEIGLSRS